MVAESWAKRVAKYPVAFSQVREDALGDLALVKQLSDSANVLMVASGGCTAALLASVPSISSITLVDPNPAQLDLCRLKLELLTRHEKDERLCLLGHSPMDRDKRDQGLQQIFQELNIAQDSFGPREESAAFGPDHIGRYEQVFARLRALLADQRGHLEHLLSLEDRSLQSKLVDPQTPLGQSLDRAFQSVFSLENLVEIFGEGATSNRVQDFSTHFLERTRICLAALPANSNPYLSQVFLGSYTAMAPWIELPKVTRPPIIKTVNKDMLSALKECPAQSKELVHLSNILDWLGPDHVEEMLALAARALKPGGWAIIRQLNSTVDILGARSEFQWDEALGQRLLNTDRSFFYRSIFVGRK
jgi:S-adenosylmethionine-diacylglycerol 3-amino-3-carboxypropyl transferase